MLRMIFASLILWQTAYSDPLSYSQKKYSSGTDYIRLTIPESSRKWTCFDENMYARIIDNAYQLEIKDSLLTYSEKQLAIAKENEILSEEQLTNLKANESNLLFLSKETMTGLNTCHQELKEETFQKWVWSGLALIIGAVGGSLATFIIK